MKHSNERISEMVFVSPPHRRSPLYYAFKIITTESPLKNILETNRSFDTDFIFLPLLFLTDSVHNSLTFSNIKLQCLSKALTFPINLWLLRHETTTGVLLFMAFWINDMGPWVNSNSSNFWSSSSVSSDLGRSINSLHVSNGRERNGGGTYLIMESVGEEKLMLVYLNWLAHDMR